MLLSSQESLYKKLHLDSIFQILRLNFTLCIWGHSNFSLTKLMLSKVHGNLHENANSAVHSQNVIVASLSKNSFCGQQVTRESILMCISKTIRVI